MSQQRSEPRFPPPERFLAAAVLLGPAAFAPSLRNVFTLPTFLVYALTTAGLIVSALVHRRRAATTLDRGLIVFVAVVAASSLLSADPRLAVFGLDRLWLFGAGGFGLLLAAFWGGAACADGREEFLLLTTLSAVVLGACAVVQACGVGPFTALWDKPTQRYGSLLGNPLALGAFLAAAAPAAAQIAVTAKERFPGRFAGAVIAAGLLLSGARGAWLAAAAGLAAWAWAGGRLKPSKRALAAAAVAGLLAAGAWAVRGGRIAAAADSARVDGWRVAVRAWRDAPVVGLGPGNYVYAFRRYKSAATARIHSLHNAHGHAHNDWLEVLATLGLLGIAVYFWLHWRAAQRLKNGDPALIGLLAAVFVQAKFNAPYFAAAWTAAAALGMLTRENKARRWPAAAALACAALAVFVAGRAAYGDAADKQGRLLRAGGRPRAAAAAFERAVARNPDAPAYRFDLANLLFDAAAAVPPEDQGPIFERIHQLALAGVIRHPLDADMSRLRAESELALGRLPEARASLRTARMLDPHMSQAILLDGFAAYLDGDGPRLAALAPLLDEIAARGHFPRHAVEACRGGQSLHRVLWHLAQKFGKTPPDLACTMR